MKTRTRKITFSLYAFGIAWGFVIVVPILLLASLSLKTRLDAFANPPKLFFTPTLAAYMEVFGDTAFLNAVKNSLIVSVGAVVLSLLIAVPATYGLRNLSGPRRSNTMLGILLIRMVPGMVYLLPFFVVYRYAGLLDTHIGLIIVHLIFNIPLIIWVLTPIWSAIPKDLGEAARIDGATPWQIFLLVDLPLVKGGILAAAILSFVFSWNEFLFALNLTRRDVVTLPVAIINFLAYEGTEWGNISAASMFIIVPALVFGFLVRRYMLAGLSNGAVKG